MDLALATEILKLTAPIGQEYGEQRSKMAKDSGLSQGGRKPEATA
jgi:predicted transcriptional regulator